MGKYLHILIFINFIYSMTGLELAQAMKNRAKPTDTQSESIMVLTNKKGKKKTLKLLSKSKDDSKKQMIWFLEPKDDYGVSFLKIENSDGDDFMNMWLPGFNKFRRISSQKKTDSFMGSDLSFEDMTNRELDEYIYKTLEVDIKCNDSTEDLCYILESIPKNPKSEYSRHITWIKKDSYLSLKEESYDKEDKLLKNKSIQYSKIDNYYIMSELDVKNIQKNHTTLLTISNIKVNLGFSDKIFHTKTIKRMPLN
jgi:outer membrane lipoprotein-sorting protein